MPRNDDIKRPLIRRSNTAALEQPNCLSHKANQPVPIDEFGRQGMGVAAKE